MSKEYQWNRRGNQIFQSGYSTFDKQTNYIGTGNVISNTQVSSFIRPYCETKCNGFDFNPGELLQSDLRVYSKMPNKARDILINKDRTEGYIYYQFYVSGEPTFWIITDKNHGFISRGINYTHRSVNKIIMASDEVMKYICK